MRIIAMGGGGFSMEPDNPRLDRYLLQATGKKCPRVVFLATASGDAEGYIERFYTAFRQYPCQPMHLSLFHGEIPADFDAFFQNVDLVYVGGGSTRNLLLLWREWGLDQALRRAGEQGTILAGLSAGSNCWFEEFVTDSLPGELTSLPGLGWLTGSHCPHYDGEEDRRPAYHRLIAAGLKAGFAADDGAALDFTNGELIRVVVSRPEARGYRVEKTAGGVQETVLLALVLDENGLLPTR